MSDEELRAQIAAVQALTNDVARAGALYALGCSLIESSAPMALALLRDAAAAGHAEAAHQAAVLLYAGVVERAEADEVLRLLTFAAERDVVGAALLLGVTLANTDQTSDGVAWLQRAARAGSWDAHYHLGMAYRRGRGLSLDLSEARLLLTLAARNGVVEAKRELSSMLRFGEGGAADEVAADAWLYQAAIEGDAVACFERAEIAERKEPADYELARRWYEAAVDAGSSKAALRLSRLYLSRRIESENSEEAGRRWFDVAAKLGARVPINGPRRDV